MTATFACPVCGEADFDAVGLKMHFTRGWCEPTEAAEKAEQEKNEAWFEKWEARRKADPPS